MLQTLQLFGESCHLLELSMNPCTQGCEYCYAKTWKRENYTIEKVVNNILHLEPKQEGLLPFLIRKRWPITISNRTDVMCTPDWRERLSAIKKLGFPICMETKLNKDYKDLAQILDPKTDPIYQTITGFNNKYEEHNLLSPEEKIEAAKWFVENGFHFTLAVNPFMPDKVTPEEIKKLIDLIKPHGLVMYDYHKTTKSVHKHLYMAEYPKEQMEAGRKVVSDYCREKGIYHSIGGFESHPYPELNLNLYMNDKFFGGNAIIFQELLIDVFSQFTPEFDVFDITFDIFRDFYKKQIKYFDGCIMKDTDYSLGSIRHPFKFAQKRFDFTYFLKNLWNQKKLHFNFDWYSDKFDDEGNLIYFRHKDGFMKEIDKR